MRYREFVIEGGWASVKTQDTTITPATVAGVVDWLRGFEKRLNQYLTKENIPTVSIGRPVGSGTYYKRDLEQNPNKEYGDIDVQFVIPRIKDQPASKNESMYYKAVADYCASSGDCETQSGKNIVADIPKIGWTQIDLVAIFGDRVEWNEVLAPEHGTKGILSSSLYSSLAAVLNISFSTRGVYAKTRDGELVPFNQRKGTELQKISTSANKWGEDLARFLGAETISKTLKDSPGIEGEVKIENITKTIQGIADTLEQNRSLPEPYSSASDLMSAVRTDYLDRVDRVINSSKFEKAASPQVQKKAEETKKMLHDRSREIAQLL